MQKFRDSLNLELQLDVRGYKVTTLRALVNKAKAMEVVRDKMKAKDEAQKGSLGKRSYGFFESRKFEAKSSLGSNKKPMYEKAPSQGQG